MPAFETDYIEISENRGSGECYRPSERKTLHSLLGRNEPVLISAENMDCLYVTGFKESMWPAIISLTSGIHPVINIAEFIDSIYLKQFLICF